MPESDLIAALYVQRNGVYWDLPGVDPWDEARDARLYAGPHPVVAHPPCARWCQLAHVNQARWGAKVGDDGGCFESALAAVRRWGGVLEHPAYSFAWPEFGLTRPQPETWTQGLMDDGWVCEVSQAAYGHKARKRTWLYVVGPRPADLDWSRPEAVAQVSSGQRADGSYRKQPLSKSEASRSPIAFRDTLLSIARSCHVGTL